MKGAVFECLLVASCVYVLKRAERAESCMAHCSRKAVNAEGLNKDSADLWVKNSLLPELSYN